MKRSNASSPVGSSTGGGIFYGWYIVAAVFVMMTVTAGLGFYNLSIYLRAFVAERDFAVSVASGATAAFFVASGAAGLFVAQAMEKYDPRWIIAISAVLGGLVLANAGLVTQVWHIYVFYTLFGVAYAGCALIPGTTLVARWFSRRRSAALSYASTGLSLGGILLTPLSAQLIDDYGIEIASRWLGLIFVLGIVPVALLVIRAAPETMGLAVDGDKVTTGEEQRSGQDGILFSQAIKSRFFKFCVIAFAFAMMAQVGAIAHQYSLVFGRTNSADTAALTLALMATSSIVGRLLGGWALAYLPSRGFIMTLQIVQALALACFALSETTPALIASAILFGLTVGNLLMMQPLIIAEAFGVRAYARLYSISQLVMTAGVASGPLVLGLVFDALGGYQSAFFVISGASLVALAIFSLTGPVDGPAKAQKQAQAGNSPSSRIL